MAYTWTDGELITAEKLNNTGGGGAGVFVIHFSDIDYQNYTAVADKTYAEAFDAFNDGKSFLVVEEANDIQYGRQRWCGAAYYVRQIGYPNAYIEVSFLLYKSGFVEVVFQIKEDGSVHYTETPIQNV